MVKKSVPLIIVVVLTSVTWLYRDSLSRAAPSEAIELHDATISTVAAAFSKHTGQSYLVDSQIDRKISITVPAGTSTEEVATILTQTLAQIGLHLFPLGDKLWRISTSGAIFQTMPRTFDPSVKVGPRPLELSGITITDDTRIYLPVKAVTSIMSAYLGSSTSLSGSALVFVPTGESQTEGTFRVASHQPGGIYEKLGFKSGDIVRSVAGKSLAENRNLAQRAIPGLLEQLSMTGESTAVIERGGSELTLRFSAPKMSDNPEAYGKREMPGADPKDGAVPEHISINIPLSELEKRLADVSATMKMARGIPYFVNGEQKPKGIRVFDIEIGSFFENIGLKNGDIILSINAQSPVDWRDTFEKLGALKEKKIIVVRLERSHRMIFINVKLV